MRKLILQEFISVDGFAADENGSTSFFENISGEVDREMLEFIKTIDTILLGANTYRMFAEFWPDATTREQMVADELNKTLKIVFSKTLEKAPWGKWDEATVVSSDAREEIWRLKSQPGKDMVLWGSLSLAQSLLKSGLIDIIDLRICPTALGKGKALFPDGIGQYGLKLFDSNTYNDSDVVLLRYKPDNK